ncbi:MAG: 3-dehydroquinate synthase II, partial [Thermoplasmata archaeon]
PSAIGALEHGADRIIIEIDEVGGLDLLEGTLENLEPPTAAWELVTVRRVKPAGIGDRVIVDTTSILRPSEGLLVGSAAAFLFHVASESEGSRFTRPRPFRVNAGAAHSYTLLADGSTRYLAELVSGDAVLIADPTGSFRSARVGRIKTERRPLSLVEVERDGHPYTIFLQDAETARLSGETGRLATTQLAPGDRIFGMPLAPARHLGTPIDETIDER